MSTRLLAYSVFLIFPILLTGQSLKLQVLSSDDTPILFPEALLINTENKEDFYMEIGDETGHILIKDFREGTYILEVGAVGYQYFYLDSISIDSDKDLGIVRLERDEGIELEEIKIQAERQTIQYRVDRLVINASAFPEANVALDLIQNVPSVQVDVNGNIKYRGDGTFKVYINGRPAANGSDKLREIPTSQIDRIEVITNPPAKYASEGTAGIIQVILKKNRLQGYAINANMFTNNFGAVNSYFSIDKKTEKSGWYIHARVNHAVWNRYKTSGNQITLEEDIIYQTITERDNKNGQNSAYLEFGMNYDLTDKDYFDISVNFNPFKSDGFRRGKGWGESLVQDSEGNIISHEEFLLKSRRNEFYQFFGGEINYEHNFNEDKSHQISAYFDISYFLGPYKEREWDEKIFDTHSEKTGLIGHEKDELMMEAKINYAFPISETGSFETGMDMEYDGIPQVSGENGIFDENNELIPFSNQRSNQNIDFREIITSGYINFKNSFRKFEYQLGLRLENTDTRADYTFTNTDGSNGDEPYRNNFNKLFPSVHLLYNLTDKTQLVANFTRRIHRADYWQFMSYQTYTGLTSYFVGNQKILPSYTNSYELAYKQSWTVKNYLSFQLFHRSSSDVINTIQHTGENGYLIGTPENVGESRSTGLEIMGNRKMNSWWESNFSASLFDYRLKVNYEAESYTVKQTNYQIKWNNTLRFPKDYNFRFNLEFYGPGQSAQSKTNSYMVSSAAIQKSFQNNKWSFTLSGYNLFDSTKIKTVTTGSHLENIYRINYRPQLSLRIAYKFDNQE